VLSYSPPTPTSRIVTSTWSYPLELNGLQAEEDAHFEGKEGVIGHQSQITEIGGPQLGIGVFCLVNESIVSKSRG
jgi:hypothetical protein